MNSKDCDLCGHSLLVGFNGMEVVSGFWKADANEELEFDPNGKEWDLCEECCEVVEGILSLLSVTRRARG